MGGAVYTVLKAVRYLTAATNSSPLPGRPYREVNDRCAWRVQDLELPETSTSLTLGSSNTAAVSGPLGIPYRRQYSIHRRPCSPHSEMYSLPNGGL
jgi:hypothetical protein